MTPKAYTEELARLRAACANVDPSHDPDAIVRRLLRSGVCGVDDAALGVLLQYVCGHPVEVVATAPKAKQPAPKPKTNKRATTKRRKAAEVSNGE